MNDAGLAGAGVQAATAPEEETRFADGNTSEVVRVGETVRRAVGPWTPAVHALLRHLEAAAFDGAPRALGLDDRGREILSFLPGETIPPDLTGFRSDEALAAIAQLLRRYHDATLGFAPPPGAEWRRVVGAPRDGPVICHNDVGPWNVVVRDGRIAGLIDFDFAAPGPRTWDVAYALWRCVPLYPGPDHGGEAWFGTPAEQGRRARLFCDAYGLGLDDRLAALDLVGWRIAASHDTCAARAAGDPAYLRLWREGHARGSDANVAYLRAVRADLRRALAPYQTGVWTYPA